MRDRISFFINGHHHEIGAEKANWMLADFLRFDQNLTGTKIVCAEGDCGACSVLRLFPHSQNAEPGYLPINSCITPLAILDGSSLITIEALEKEGILHQTQKAMIECHGSQCGFCTPGFVMALTGLVEKKLSANSSSIQKQEAKNALTGNLCRCTGYEPILDSALRIDLKSEVSLKTRFFTPKEERTLRNSFKTPLLIETPEFSFYAPKTIEKASRYLKDHPETKLIGSATDLGVVQNKSLLKPKSLMSLHLIEELYTLKETSSRITVGARVTLTELRDFLRSRFPKFANYLDLFASPQIKNIATLVGNIANASPIGDTAPVLLSLSATLKIASNEGTRTLPLNDFFLSYRKTALQKGEFIREIEFEVPNPQASVRFFKNSIRKDLDISTLNLAIHVSWEDTKKTSIQDIKIAAGGVAETSIRLKKTESFLRSKSISQDTLRKAVQVLHQEFTPLTDLRGSDAYRHLVIENYFNRFFTEVAEEQVQ